jgi:hypothetical protein
MAVLVGASVYAATAVWHFYEHSQHRDPDVAHLLLVLSQVVMLGGAVAAALAARGLPVRRRHRRGVAPRA